MAHLMKYSLLVAMFYSLLSIAQVAQADSAAGVSESVCDRCTTIINEIRGTLIERCDSAPTVEQLRQQPIYLFLSIFDEVSQGGDQKMAEKVYQAALAGMQCDNPDAGVKAAQQMANKLMVESRT
ncbi:MAG: hypothetical protein V7752_03450 [Halopseudomonas sp.]